MTLEKNNTSTDPYSDQNNITTDEYTEVDKDSENIQQMELNSVLDKFSDLSEHILSPSDVEYSSIEEFMNCKLIPNVYGKDLDEFSCTNSNIIKQRQNIITNLNQYIQNKVTI